MSVDWISGSDRGERAVDGRRVRGAGAPVGRVPDVHPRDAPRGADGGKPRGSSEVVRGDDRDGLRGGRELSGDYEAKGIRRACDVARLRKALGGRDGV